MFRRLFFIAILNLGLFSSDIFASDERTYTAITSSQMYISGTQMNLTIKGKTTTLNSSINYFYGALQTTALQIGFLEDCQNKAKLVMQDKSKYSLTVYINISTQCTYPGYCSVNLNNTNNNYVTCTLNNLSQNMASGPGGAVVPGDEEEKD